MKIGYLLDDTLDSTDGVQQAVIAIGERMRSLGHEVHYIVAETSRSDLKNVHPIAQYIRLKFNGNSVRTPKPVSKKVIAQLHAELSLDVLHVQMPYSPFFAARVIKAAPKSTNIIGTFHIAPYSTTNALLTRLLGLVLRSSLRRIHTYLAVSEPAAQFMNRSFGVTGSVVPNPVDVAYFQKFRQKQATQRARAKIVFVGRFDKRKGVEKLLRAYAHLVQSGTKAELVLCGKGPEFLAMQQLAGELGVEVDFKGFVSEEEKARQLASATVAVFPSISGESFGIVLAEAMAAGAGVTIGGDNVGYRSVLAPWEDTLFDPRDIEAFADKLKQCIENETLRNTIGSQQQQAVKAYAIEVVADSLLKVYS